MPGVVSVPHGWGHGAPGARLHVADGQPGVNANCSPTSSSSSPVSGTVVLNGIPVTLTPA